MILASTRAETHLQKLEQPLIGGKDRAVLGLPRWEALHLFWGGSSPCGLMAKRTSGVGKDAVLRGIPLHLTVGVVTRPEKGAACNPLSIPPVDVYWCLLLADTDTVWTGIRIVR